jgi:hypothetical protein
MIHRPFVIRVCIVVSLLDRSRQYTYLVSMFSKVTKLFLDIS